MSRPAQNVLAFDDRAIKSAKLSVEAATSKRGWERPIKGVPGLYLRLTKNGAGIFVYRYRIAGAHKRVVIGDRRAVTKEYARDRAIEFYRQVRAGDDPARERELTRSALSLNALVDEFMTKADRPGARTKRDYREALERDVFDKLGELPAQDITAPAIARVLEAAESRAPAYKDRRRPAPVGYRGTNAAHKARCALGSVYRWAVKRQLVLANPCVGLGYIQRPMVRERKIANAELAQLWNAIGGAPGLSDAMRRLLKLIVLTGQRSSEVAGAQRCELELDGLRSRWSIPAERMKRKRPQVIALSLQATELFRAACAATLGDVLFPADRARAVRGTGFRAPRKAHIHGESVSKAMTRICARVEIENLHVHDMRKAFATWASDHGLLPHVVDYILHHAAKTTTGQHYDFGTLDPQVRPALQAWADHVEAVAAQSPNCARRVRNGGLTVEDVTD